MMVASELMLSCGLGEVSSFYSSFYDTSQKPCSCLSKVRKSLPGVGLNILYCSFWCKNELCCLHSSFPLSITSTSIHRLKLFKMLSKIKHKLRLEEEKINSETGRKLGLRYFFNARKFLQLYKANQLCSIFILAGDDLLD